MSKNHEKSGEKVKNNAKEPDEDEEE